MFLAKVTGSLVSTQKVNSMVGHKLLLVEPYRVAVPDGALAAGSPGAFDLEGMSKMQQEYAESLGSAS